jgi:DNA processing protein
VGRIVSVSDLVDRLADLAAPGTDPHALAAVLGWLVRPRRGPDGLRRAVRDQAGSDRAVCDKVGPDRAAHEQAGPDRAARDRSGSDPGMPDRGGGEQPPESTAATLARVAGRPSVEAARAAGSIADAWRDAGVRVALVGDPSYPARLAAGWPHLPAPPLLAWRGAVPDETAAVAIVGSRRASGYGTAVSAWLAEAVAAAGARVVSGGALGIDAAAHEAARELPGGTTVVLGCGHAVAYPRTHARPGGLFDRIVDGGGSLVSELLPHEPPRPGQVRARNRIVAAMADVVVVVEGGSSSGALLTASAAAEWGRTVLAVPGDVRAPGSAAPHRLLQEGAAPCTGPADLLEVLASELAAGLGTSRVGGVSGASGGASGNGGAAGSGDARSDGGATIARGVRGETPTPHPRGQLARSVLDQAVYDALAQAWPRPLRLEMLATRCGLPAPRLLAQLTRARIAGEIAEGPDGLRLRRAPVEHKNNSS